MTREETQLRLDPSSDVPAYRQIVDQLRALVVEGVLRPGDTLPAVRKLALELGVHFNTVAESFRTLSQEGLLEITHGHGARVAGRTAAPEAGPEVAESFRQRLRELVAGVRARGMSSRQVAAEMKTIMEAMENQ